MKKITLISLFLMGINSVLAGDLKIHVINVGWGQSVLIEGVNGKTILFDAGLANKRQVVSGYLQQQNVQQLDYFILSHNHSDHGGGAEYVIREFKPKLSYYSGASENADRVFMKNWFSSYQEANATSPVGLPLGFSIDLGDGATATAIAVNGNVYNKAAVIAKLRETDSNYQFPESNHINDSSIVLLVKYKGFDYLVSGDLGGHEHNGQADFETPVIMSALISGEGNINTPNGGIDILHIGHHGSKTSTNNRYLDLAKPEVALVSVGPNQSHGLPNSETIDDLLLAKGIKVLQTDEGRLNDSRISKGGYVVGHIQISTNGQSYLITSDESSIDRSKDSQANVQGESILAGLPLTQLVDHVVIPAPEIDVLPILNTELLSAAILTLNIEASDDKGLITTEIFIDQVLVKSYALNNDLNRSLIYSFDPLDYSQSTHEILVKVVDSAEQVVTKILSFDGQLITPPAVETEFFEIEANNSSATSNQISDSITQIKGYFPTTNDNYDWFTFDLIAGHTLNLTMVGPNNNQQDYDVYLYSEAGTLLEYSEAVGSIEQLSYRNGNSAKTKILRLKVTRYSGSSSQIPYEISLSRK